MRTGLALRSWSEAWESRPPCLGETEERRSLRSESEHIFEQKGFCDAGGGGGGGDRWKGEDKYIPFAAFEDVDKSIDIHQHLSQPLNAHDQQEIPINSPKQEESWPLLPHST